MRMWAGSYMNKPIHLAVKTHEFMKIVGSDAVCSICNFKFGPNEGDGAYLESLMHRISKHHQTEHRVKS